MQIQTSKEMDKKINKVSKVLGLGKEEIVDRAIEVYLDNISKYVELKKDFKDWDELSDEAFANFEKSL